MKKLCKIVPVYFYLLIFMLTTGCTAHAQTVFKKNVYHRTSSEIEKDFPKEDAYNNQQLIHSKLLFSIYELLCIGDYKNSLSRQDSIYAPSFSFIDSLNHYKEAADYYPVAAKEYIFEKAKRSRIIIINENHNQPMHRVFVQELLKGLYSEGFRYFAAEAIENDSSINSNKTLALNDGYYTAEPRFANMIREGISLGYTFAGYEFRNENELKKRDYYQALHIKEKMLDKDPAAKIIIYCGFEHNDETVNAGSASAMAGWIKLLTGIDPLSIDQVFLTESSSTGFENTSYSFFHPAASSVFIDKRDSAAVFIPFDRKTQCDVYVYHPRTVYKNKRPAWLISNAFYKEYAVPVNKINISYPLLVMAYNVNENPEISIPLDVTELKNNADKKNLILKSGYYKLLIRNNSGKEQTMTIHVD